MKHNNKSKKRNVKKISGGNCGCSGGSDPVNISTTTSNNVSSTFSFFKGGSSCGGEQPSFSGVPMKSFYDLKDETSNPLYTQVASRLSGGKKNKRNTLNNKKTKKNKNNKNNKLRKRGGGIFSEPEIKLLPTNTMV